MIEFVTFECPKCGVRSEQDAREVEWGLIVECCGVEMREHSRTIQYDGAEDARRHRGARWGER